MKNLVVVLIFLTSIYSFSQSNEFTIHSNGLIYSESTMFKLSNIVDSLNLRFKTCDLNKVLHSKSQTIGYVVRMNKGNIKGAKKDIENQIDFNAFIRKYTTSEITSEALIVKYKYRNYQNKDVVEFSEVNLNGNNGFEINEVGNPKIYDKEMKGKWLYTHYKKSDYSKETLSAFYFPNEFNSKPLKDKYARMVGYADCLIDTTAVKFKENAKSGWVDLPKNWSKLTPKKKDRLLEKMRDTKVVGMCSMDSRPREHAMNIAVLSAETTMWEIFLRSHLDIMNDRFDRLSDGSYAWKDRNTYIRELEELDINISDLIFGISLRIEHPAKNHYFGNIQRIGRALAETQNREEIEKTILAMIEDPELDDYNRIISYYLFLNYNNHLNDESSKLENVKKLNRSIHSLPEHLKSKII